MSEPIRFTVPSVPPSVNAYVRHTRSGRHYISSEAKKFKEDLMMCSRGCRVRAKSYGVSIDVYLGSKQKGDLDNFAKCVLDALVYAEVIDTDARVTALQILKGRDRQRPRTQICVWAIS